MQYLLDKTEHLLYVFINRNYKIIHNNKLTISIVTKVAAPLIIDSHMASGVYSFPRITITRSKTLLPS